MKRAPLSRSPIRTKSGVQIVVIERRALARAPEPGACLGDAPFTAPGAPFSIADEVYESAVRRGRFPAQWWRP